MGGHFNPEVGFVPRAGYRKTNYFYRFHNYPNSGPDPKLGTSRLQTGLVLAGKTATSNPTSSTTTWIPSGTTAPAWVSPGTETSSAWTNPWRWFPGSIIPEGGYGYDEIIANYRTDPSAPLFLSGTAAAGGFYDGNIRSLNLNGGYRHSHRLSWTVSYLRNMVRLQAGDFNVDLVGLRFNWSFTPKSFLQTFSQYNSVSQTLGHNIRLGLLSSASTGLYVVYNTSNSTTPLPDSHRLPRRTLTRAPVRQVQLSVRLLRRCLNPFPGPTATAPAAPHPDRRSSTSELRWPLVTGVEANSTPLSRRERQACWMSSTSKQIWPKPMSVGLGTGRHGAAGGIEILKGLDQSVGPRHGKEGGGHPGVGKTRPAAEFAVVDRYLQGNF